MPVQLRVDPAAGMIFTTFSGVITDGDLGDYRTALASDPAILPTFHELVDLSAVEAISASSDALRRATLSRTPTPPARRAVIAPADFAYGVARMLQMEHPDDALVAVFRDRDSARAWLGLDV